MDTDVFMWTRVNMVDIEHSLRHSSKIGPTPGHLDNVIIMLYQEVASLLPKGTSTPQ